MTKLVIGLRKTVFNATMRDARKAKGLTLQDLALLIYAEEMTDGIAHSSGSRFSNRLSTYETMRAVPPPDIAQEIADALEVKLDDIFPDLLREMPRAKTQWERVPMAEMQLPGAEFPELSHVLEVLNPRERHVVKERFGLNEDGEQKGLQQVGEELGVSRERVRQIEKHALTKIRQRMPKELRTELSSD